MAGKCDHCHQYAETVFTHDTGKPSGVPSVWQKKGVLVYSLCEHCEAELCAKLEKVLDECKRTGEPYAEKSADVVLDYLIEKERRCPIIRHLPDIDLQNTLNDIADIKRRYEAVKHLLYQTKLQYRIKGFNTLLKTRETKMLELAKLLVEIGQSKKLDPKGELGVLTRHYQYTEQGIIDLVVEAEYDMRQNQEDYILLNVTVTCRADSADIERYYGVEIAPRTSSELVVSKKMVSCADGPKPPFSDKAYTECKEDIFALTLGQWLCYRTFCRQMEADITDMNRNIEAGVVDDDIPTVIIHNC